MTGKRETLVNELSRHFSKETDPVDRKVVFLGRNKWLKTDDSSEIVVEYDPDTMDGDGVVCVLSEKFTRTMDPKQSKILFALYVPTTDEQLMCKVEHSDTDRIVLELDCRRVRLIIYEVELKQLRSREGSVLDENKTVYDNESFEKEAVKKQNCTYQ